MKRSDITPEQVIDACAKANGCTDLYRAYPTKVVDAALEREVKAGTIDYGVSLRTAWPTRKEAV